MAYIQKSFLPRQKITSFSPWTHEQVQEYILNESKYFIAVDNKFLLSETKKDFTDKGKKFLMVEIKTIERLKKFNNNIHYILNKGAVDETKITISLTSFNNSGLYMDIKDAADDIKIIIDEYDKRRATYQHNLNQTNKSIKLLMTASADILNSYPEKFI